MTTYRTKAEIDFRQPLVIQQRVAGGQFSNTVPADTALVFENGIWKYPAVAAAGAIEITYPVRLVSIVADLGAGGATWTGHIAGNPNNTTGEPYPAGDAANYAEGTITFATGTAGQYINLHYEPGMGPIFLPGQRFYLVSVSATDPMMRVWFAPF